MELKFTPDRLIAGLVQVQKILSEFQVEDDTGEHCSILNVDIVRYPAIGKKTDKDNLKIMLSHEVMCRLFSVDDGLEFERDEVTLFTYVVKRYGKLEITSSPDRQDGLRDYGFDPRVHSIKYI